GRGQQAVLHILAALAVAREDDVGAFQYTCGLPLRDLVAVEEIVFGVSLAEDQPVAAWLTARGARLQVAAQAGQAGAVADQDQRTRGIVAETEIGMRAQPQIDDGAEGRSLRQPARSHAERAVGTTFL